MVRPNLRAVSGADDDPAEEPHGLTVEELARETGMTVRNIRNHQSRGLLPPPEVRARTGYYGTRHVERLRLIQALQAEGLKLTAIERLLGDDGADAARLVDLRRAWTGSSGTDASEIYSAEDLAERFGPLAENEKSLDRAVKLELLVPLGDGRFEAPSPALLRAAEEVTRRGVPLPAALAVIERVKRNSRATAHAFVELFLKELWKPFDAAGRPDERWPEITESIERLRPLASEAVLAIFDQTMASEVEDAFGKVLEQGAQRRK